MSVSFYYDVVDNSNVYRVHKSSACFGGLASHVAGERAGWRIVDQTGSRIFNRSEMSTQLINKITKLDTDEIVYDVMSSLSRSNGMYILGMTKMYSLPVLKVRLRNLFSDFVMIQKEIPWMEPLSFDFKSMSVNVNTNFPADQVFACLSVIRNIISYNYPHYLVFLGKGFSRKDSFLLSQNFKLVRDAFGSEHISIIPPCDYMMCHHGLMRDVDVENLFNGVSFFKQVDMKNSGGYLKYINDSRSLTGVRDTSQIDELFRVFGAEIRHYPNSANFLDPLADGDYIFDSDTRDSIIESSDISDEQIQEAFESWVSILNEVNTNG
ncbi:hypothetical protein LAh9_57 [Aeromonas phage LAh_9]|uniref:Uncharacterized protein n=1 Tax=Aeromonas phage LAh_9 TaxID=2591033 RepID=A0A514A0X9_9CAUD|nr:hypothetical protein HWC32_gp057 [Aeromonas phage LAh_9]QDH46882.1 hypothetical protein LAh9_57 [Aeromonas phage LAh_9]